MTVDALDIGRWKRGPFLADRIRPGIDHACNHFEITRRDFFDQGQRTDRHNGARRAVLLAIDRVLPWSDQQAATATRMLVSTQRARLQAAHDLAATNPSFLVLVREIEDLIA